MLRGGVALGSDGADELLRASDTSSPFAVPWSTPSAPSSSGDEEDDASGARARRRRLAVLAFADEFAARQVAQLVSEFEGYPAVVVRFERDVVLEWVRAGGETEQGEMGGGWRASTASGGEVHRCDDADNDGAADGDGDGDAIFVVGVVG